MLSLADKRAKAKAKANKSENYFTELDTLEVATTLRKIYITATPPAGLGRNGAWHSVLKIWLISYDLECLMKS